MRFELVRSKLMKKINTISQLLLYLYFYFNLNICVHKEKCAQHVLDFSNLVRKSMHISFSLLGKLICN